jgi:hypothetical protein
MDFTEQAFLRVHHRLTGLLSTFLTPRFRRCLECLCLFYAVTLLGVLVFMHINFVGQVRRRVIECSFDQMRLGNVSLSRWFLPVTGQLQKLWPLF